MVDSRVASVDIVVRWGVSVVHAAHLAPPRAFYVGEPGEHACDVALPAAALGATQAPIVRVDRGGDAWLVVLPRAAGTLALAGKPAGALHAVLGQDARVRRYERIRGAREVPFPLGSKASVELGGVVFEIEHATATHVIARAPSHARGAHLAFAIGVAVALHAGVLSLKVPLGATDEEVASDQTYGSIAYMPAVDGEVEPVEPVATELAAFSPDGHVRVDSRCSDQHGGTMGDPVAYRARRRYGIEGPADNPDPHIARFNSTAGPAFQAYFGLPTGDYDERKGPTAPWGRDDSLGNDAMSARGAMWGEDIGEALGSPGSGIGLQILCATCGAWGHGLARNNRTAGGGATATEKAGATTHLDDAGARDGARITARLRRRPGTT